MELKYQETSIVNTELFLKAGSQRKEYCHSIAQSPQNKKSHGLALNNLKRLDYTDRKTITNYAEQYNQYCCEFSYSNLYLWNDIYHYKIAYFNDWLVIIDPENDYCLMPLGNNITASGLQSLSESLIKTGYSGDISNVPPEIIENLPELSHYYDIENYKELAEYIYTTKKLIELKGKKLRKKKNFISQFKRKYPDYQVRPMNSVTRNNCLKMSEKIVEKLSIDNKTVSKGILNERISIRKAFNSFDVLPLEGIAIYVQDSLVAYSIYSRLNKDVFTTHFEKADYSYRGSAQVINWETAKALKGRCTYINREQDLGVPGLRKAKLSYEPTLIYSANYLSFKE